MMKLILLVILLLALIIFVIVHVIWYIQPSEIETYAELQTYLRRGQPTVIEVYSNY